MDNPVINDLQAEGLALRAQAEAETATPEPSSATPPAETRASAPEETPAAETAPAPQVEGEAPKPKEPAANTQQKEEPKPADKEPSAYEKAKARQAKAWQEIEAEKTRLKTERAEIDRLRQQATQKPPEKPTAAPFKDAAGYTAADYEAFAKQCEDDGDAETAVKAKAKAIEVRAQEAEHIRTQTQTGAQSKHERAMQEDLGALIKAEPEYGKPDSAHVREMNAFLQEHPWIGDVPGGYTKAAQVLQLQREAAQVPALRERAEKAERERDDIIKRTSIGGGSPAGPVTRKSFNDMSETEQREFLIQSVQADNRLTA